MRIAEIMRLKILQSLVNTEFALYGRILFIPLEEDYYRDGGLWYHRTFSSYPADVSDASALIIEFHSGDQRFVFLPDIAYVRIDVTVLLRTCYPRPTVSELDEIPIVGY